MATRMRVRGRAVDAKGPGGRPGPASLSVWECVHKSGGGGSKFLDRHLLFRSEPIFLLVTVLPPSFLIEFVGALADLVFEFEVLWIAGHTCGRFLRGIFVHGGNSLEPNVRLNNRPDQLPKFGAVGRDAVWT